MCDSLQPIFLHVSKCVHVFILLPQVLGWTYIYIYSIYTNVPIYLKQPLLPVGLDTQTAVWSLLDLGVYFFSQESWLKQWIIPKFSMYGILNIYLCIHLPQIYKLNVDKHCIHGAFGIYLLNVLTVNYWSNLPSPIGFGYFDTHWSQEKMQFLWHQFKPYKTFCFFALRG